MNVWMSHAHTNIQMMRKRQGCNGVEPNVITLASWKVEVKSAQWIATKGENKI